jgi:hypothetical protein
LSKDLKNSALKLTLIYLSLTERQAKVMKYSKDKQGISIKPNGLL